MNKQFEEWLQNWILNSSLATEYEKRKGVIDVSQWDTMPFEMRWGVYLEFLRSVDTWVEIISETPQSHFIRILGPDIMSPFYKKCEDIYFEGSIEDAMIKAKDVAFEILETQLKDNGC